MSADGCLNMGATATRIAASQRVLLKNYPTAQGDRATLPKAIVNQLICQTRNLLVPHQVRHDASDGAAERATSTLTFP